MLQVQPPYTFTLSMLVVASVSLSIPVAAVTTPKNIFNPCHLIVLVYNRKN